MTFYEKRRGRRFNEDRGKIRWRGFRDSRNPWCALSVHWISRGVIVVIVYRPTYSSYEPIRVPLSFCLVRHSLKGSLGEDINLLTGRRVLTKFLAGTVLPSITYLRCSNEAIGRSSENVQILAGILDAVIASVACRPARVIVDYVSKRGLKRVPGNLCG